MTSARRLVELSAIADLAVRRLLEEGRVEEAETFRLLGDAVESLVEGAPSVAEARALEGLWLRLRASLGDGVPDDLKELVRLFDRGVKTLLFTE